jgi:hypothetical protein
MARHYDRHKWGLFGPHQPQIHPAAEGTARPMFYPRLMSWVSVFMAKLDWLAKTLEIDCSSWHIYAGPPPNCLYVFIYVLKNILMLRYFVNLALVVSALVKQKCHFSSMLRALSPLSQRPRVCCFGKTFPVQVLWAFGQINIGRVSHVVCVFKNPMWFQSGAGKYLWKYWRTATRIHVSVIWSRISIRQFLSAQCKDEIIDWGLQSQAGRVAKLFIHQNNTVHTPADFLQLQR